MDATRLAAYQSRATAKLPDVCDIERPTRTRAGLDTVEAPATVAAGVRCRVYELGEGRGEREAELGGAMRSEGSHVVRLPVGTDVRHKDVIVWGGRRLTVQRALHRSYATTLTVLCMEVTP